MDVKPNRGTILDYALKWGTECLFPDLKTRGFRITQTHLTTAKRIDTFLLILALAVYWATGIGASLSEPPLKKAG